MIQPCVQSLSSRHWLWPSLGQTTVGLRSVMAVLRAEAMTR